MTAGVLPHAGIFDRSSSAVRTDEYEMLRILIANQLRHGPTERLDTNRVFGNIETTPQISGAIYLALQPKQFKFLITDARISIVMALQRHLTNEQYRMRLSAEFHYRAFRPHLSEAFRMLMVRPSNWKKYRHIEGRKPNLAAAYQDEIEQLEARSLRCARSLVDLSPLAVTRHR